jgi:hypothetical protein
VLFVALAASQLLGHTHAAIRVWAVLSLVMCLLPVVIWAAGRRPAPLRQPERTPSPPVLAAPDVVRTVRPRTPAVTFVGNRAAEIPQTQESSR